MNLKSILKEMFLPEAGLYNNTSTKNVTDNPDLYPKLYDLVQRGDVWVDAGMYIAINRYGDHVELGALGEEEDIEQFVKSRPGGDW